MPVNPLRLLPLLTNPAAPQQNKNLFRPLDIATSGLSAQRLRMEVISTNVANAETTRGPDGTPYRRRVVRMEEAQNELPPPTFPPLPSEQGEGIPPMDPTSTLGGVRVTAVEEDPSEGPLVYDPGHPDADANGYVRYPNVRVTDELVALLEAKRAYEANVSVFQAAKQILQKSLQI